MPRRAFVHGFGLAAIVGRGDQADWDAGRVRLLRHHLRETQQQFGGRLGTRQQTVSEWETGASRPRGISRRLLHLVMEEVGFYRAESSGEGMSRPEHRRAATVTERVAGAPIAERPGGYGGSVGEGQRAASWGAAARPPERDLTAAWLLGWVPARLLPWPLLRRGRAGRGPSPDMREAAFLTAAGVPHRGHVEVHRRASDFRRH